ncbi:MAG: M48 family metallopeptidase [bacterium]|nr:M48 family metallopeptidase [bacterium]
MDFFASQDSARRQTGRLVVLFALATVSIVASVYLVVVLALSYASKRVVLWQPELLAVVVVATTGVIVLGSLYKIGALRGGGSSVAESLGGRRLLQDSQDPLERKILNVVEEMAIASGTAVPPVYLMERESGINAFAAGYTPSDAVIGVTRGCVEQLSRDELQGVVAHEFSHILNGDMRLNIRLIGILHGILVIGMIGYYVLRTAAYSRRGKDSGGAAILAIGAGLAVVGFAGTFFGNLIKAGVSRQREYLADASAVQFTRDPQGVSGALKRIGAAKSLVENPAAVEVSHMFFARGIASGFSSMFSTHPPLPDRIRRIDPGWDGNYPPPLELVAPPPTADKTEQRGFDVGKLVTGAAILAGAAGAAGAAEGRGVTEQVGNPTPEHVAYAAEVVRELPEPIAAAAREPYGARAVVYAMLINRDADARAVQLERVSGRADPGVATLTRELLPLVEELDARARLPLVDLAIPALRELSPAQYTVFRDNVTALVQADDRIDLFEWVLQRVLLHHLDPQFDAVAPTRVQYYALKQLGGPVGTFLSALAWAGNEGEAQAGQAFDAGSGCLEIAEMHLLDKDNADLSALDAALEVLDTVSFACKRELLEAAAACIRQDRKVSLEEAELFRGVADSLGCPVPPFLGAAPGDLSAG